MKPIRIYGIICRPNPEGSDLTEKELYKSLNCERLKKLAKRIKSKTKSLNIYLLTGRNDGRLTAKTLLDVLKTDIREASQLNGTGPTEESILSLIENYILATDEGCVHVIMVNDGDESRTLLGAALGLLAPEIRNSMRGDYSTMIKFDWELDIPLNKKPHLHSLCLS
jgi:hypothetical protein